MSELFVSTILPTRNPDPTRLTRVIAALAAQTLPRESWELLLVDNASDRPWAVQDRGTKLPQIVRLSEPVVGLTPARVRGIQAARAGLLVFVDDDNVLAPDYLARAVARFAERAELGAAGGVVAPEWEKPPADWTREFHGLLALRDAGPEVRVCHGGPNVRWPDFAPVGAGLIIRCEWARAYVEAIARDPTRRALDRRGASMASGGDNDLVFTALRAGADVGYLPDLRLTHLIPQARLEAAYLARLNRGIMRSWVNVLALHGQCPWPRIPRWTVRVRFVRAWIRHRHIPNPVRRVRLAGILGQFEGQADLRNMKRANGDAR